MIEYRDPAAFAVVFSVIMVLSVGAAPAGASVGSSTPDTSLGSAVSSSSSVTGVSVSDCTVINSSGRYELTQDITAPADQPCIFINASDVVFDGNGYTIRGNGSGDTDGYPIVAYNGSKGCYSCSSLQIRNVTVRDVRVVNWSKPIRFHRGAGTVVENVVVRDSFNVRASLAQGRGLEYFKGADNRVVDSRFVDLYSFGIESTNADNLTIAGSVVRDGRVSGILIDRGINHTIRNSVVAGNGKQGIVADKDFARPDNMLIANSTIRSNANNGILFRGLDNSRIRNNTITNNNNGIRARGRLSNNLTVEGNTIHENREAGVKLVRSEDSVVRNNSVRRNGIHGILVDQSSANTTVRNNTVVARAADGDAVIINSASNVTVEDNVLANHTQGRGIYVDGDYDGFRATENVVCSNQVGVEFDAYTSGTGTIDRNKIASNDEDGVQLAFNVPVERIDLRHNLIENNGNYGVNYRFGESGVVPATDNWWGASDGPSSPGTTPLADPFTGALANGSGDAVSENESNSGVSNVNFDPWLTAEPQGPGECPAANEPPSVSADDGDVTVDEGGTATNGGSFSDPDGDAVNLTASVGTVTKNADGTWEWSYPAADGPDDTQSVTITATDEDGAINTTTFDLTVENLPPTVSDDGDVTVDEGETATTTGSFGDPGEDVVNLSASVGAVTKNADGTWEWSYPAADGPDDSQTVTITAEDEDGATNETTFDLTVENLPPSVTADDNTVTVNETETATNTGTFGDPGGDNVSLSASTGTLVENADGTWNWTFETTDGPDQSQTVTVTATDEDGATNETTFDLTVENLPPSVSADDDSVTVAEGQTATNTGTYSDPGNDTVNLSASVGTVTKNDDGTWDWSFDATDGPNQSGTVTVTATDEDGTTNETTFDLTVENLPPSVSADNDTVTVDQGETATNTGTWADPGDDNVSLSASTGTVVKNDDGTWSWTYDTSNALAGNQTVTITATDEDGASANTTFDLTIEQVLQPGKDFDVDFKGCSEVWIVFTNEDQLPVDASIQVYNAESDAEQDVNVLIESDDIERVPGQYDGRPVYKFNVHDYFDRDDDGDDKVLAVSVGGSRLVENSHRCAENTDGDGDRNGGGNGSGRGPGRGK